MSDPKHRPHSAEHWDERYSGDRLWSGNPNQALVTETAHLSPGRALDVGCGEGADAVWLAGRGWEVTALDVSSRAVELTLRAVEDAGLSAEGVPAGLIEAQLNSGSFDLVSGMFPALLRTSDDAAERTLLNLVAPGGTLLVVHHADVDREHALAHGCDPDDYVSPDDVRRVAEQLDGWIVVTNERRVRDAVQGAGSHHTDDLVLRLQRA